MASLRARRWPLTLKPSWTSTRQMLRQYALTLFYITAGCTYIQDYHYRIHPVRGLSMAPLLSPSYGESGAMDVVLFKQNVPKRDLCPGMVVSFLSPTTNELAIKRIVAVEGDMVKLRPKRTTSNGALAKNCLYSDDVDTVTIPYGHVWVEGDQVNRQYTYDSNDYGPISKNLIKGVGLRILLPSARRGEIDWQTGWEEQRAERIQRAGKEYRKPAEWAVHELEAA